MKAEEKNQCPEFPFFGATYPDARCIDGYLWDLDKCNDNGQLYGGGDEPCPFCNTKEFIDQDCYFKVDDFILEKGITEEQATAEAKEWYLNWIENLKKQY